MQTNNQFPKSDSLKQLCEIIKEFREIISADDIRETLETLQRMSVTSPFFAHEDDWHKQDLIGTPQLVCNFFDKLDKITIS